ncbi:sensor histidine kinase [Longimycelium tulufanense]|uniref:sensor histidine kinase n=1 Tax=Longimycelium tulufanense TaxID=907463 RepID=UPI001668FD2A|nr:nitrate- and nitrite sensing domain-containing protein [Longimycelium tulufanense]
MSTLRRVWGVRRHAKQTEEWDDWSNGCGSGCPANPGAGRVSLSWPAPGTQTRTRAHRRARPTPDDPRHDNPRHIEKPRHHKARAGRLAAAPDRRTSAGPGSVEPHRSPGGRWCDVEDLLTVARQDTTPSVNAGDGSAGPFEDHHTEHEETHPRSSAESSATPESTPDHAVDPRRPRPSGWSRWRLQNFRLRTKLIAVFLVPAAAAVVLAGMRIDTELDNAEQFDKYVRHVELAERTAELVQDLQGERNLVAAYVANGRDGDRSAMDSQTAKVDNAISQVVSTAVALDQTNSAVKEPFRRALDRLSSVRPLRQAALSSKYPDTAVVANYTEIIDALLEANHAAANATAGTEIAQTARAADAVGRAKEQVAEQHALLLVGAAHDTLLPADIEEVRDADARFHAAREEFINAATPDQNVLFTDKVSGPEVDERSRIKQAALARASQSTGLGFQADLWDKASTVTTQLVRDVEKNLAQQLRVKSQELADEARGNALRDAALVLAALLLALGVTLIVARAMLRPLRVLRVTALDVARARLPEAIQRMRDAENEVPEVKVEPVRVRSTEEIGEVARAFDAVHNQAVRLAAEQALLRANVNAMFVNLSRRSQTLVERQLSLIDRLEQDEQDPDQLGHLFELDHLATRMRRNSENLLVLAGTDLTRRLSRPIPVSDVIGAAVSEVEQYARVDVAPTPELAVQGRAVNDLVHLIAELLDNATAFSDPSSRVSVRTARTRGSELVIEITDRGVGMPDEDLAVINERLADPPRVDVGVSRRMGLYVVARLAKRHDIKVRLRSEELEGGLIALVTVPRELLVQLSPDPGPSSLPSGSGTMPPLTGTQPGFLPPPGRNETTGGQPAVPDPGPRTGEQPAVTEAPTSFTLPVSFTTGDGVQDPAAVPQVSADGAPTERWPESGPDSRPELELELADADGRCDPAESPGSLFWSASEAETATMDAAEIAAGHPLPAAQTGAADATAGWTVGTSQEGVHEVVDAPTERLPIYEAVLTQWFQSVADEVTDENSSPKSSAGARPDPLASLGRSGEPAEPPAAAPEPEPAEPLPKRTPRRPEDIAAEAAPSRPAPSRPSTRLGRPRPDQPPVPSVPSSPATPQNNSSWGSGDEGWAKAKELLTPKSDGVTSAGLPKRVPKAHLVPGSAAPRQQQQPSKPLLPTPPRSADMVRGRLSSFQQGLRRGRHRLDDRPPADETPNPSQSRHDEEHE